MIPTSNLMSVKFRVPAKKLEDEKNIIAALGGQIDEEETDDSIAWEEVLLDSQPGKILRALRYRDGKSQKWLSEQLGMKQPNVSAMEKGERPIGKSIAKKLGELFNISYKVFL
ncbi:MAG TPA: helix-turn-helix transcriptional regulator [Candidatus Rifleibacterium sp.]|nr:helix-turn-helix transcriptional regulator [Candidatus Rifleibacterium sp.]HPT46206.1 helix-turn-helix transcriptional regulator [Candidatus Rifleibacterium sp.]